MVKKVVRTKISVSLFRLITEMGGNYNLVKFKWKVGSCRFLPRIDAASLMPIQFPRIIISFAFTIQTLRLQDT